MMSTGSVAAAGRCASCQGELRPGRMRATRSDGGIADIASCLTCGLMQVFPLPSDVELARYYHTYAYARPGAWDAPASVTHSLSKLVTTLERFRENNHFLDVGCGAGFLLQAARQQGWNVAGTELSSVAAERLRTRGFSIFNNTEPNPDVDSFDVITLVEVVEHVRDPYDMLQRMYRLLRDGGALYLTTPNVTSLSCRLLKEKWRIIEVPEHLFYFSPQSIRHLLERLGFRNVTIKTEGINPADVLNCLIRARAKPGSASSNSTAVLRDAAYNHVAIGIIKDIVNAGLRWTSLGDTLKVLAVK